MTRDRPLEGKVAIVTGGAKSIVSPSARNITGHDVPVDAGWDV
jgi:NAD(P)-dependent dehydrogenase (short-subunit alcohol dehydrogenase family)